MKIRFKTTASSLLLAAALMPLAPDPAGAAPTIPSRVSTSQFGQFPYLTSGIIWNQSGHGSGTVAVDPRVAVSCAHVTFNNGTWLTDSQWALRHHSSTHPSNSSSRQSLRGYYHWSSYSGGTSGSAFNLDFVTHYSFSNLANGAYAGTTRNESASSHSLASTSVNKMMVGYAGNDSYYMNSVGSFKSRFTSSYGHYLWNPSVKAIPGMSGGGVFAYTGGNWRLAGVTVSALRNGGMGAGIRALNQSAFNVITAATTSASATRPATTTRTFGSTSSLSIPDNSTAWTMRAIAVSGMPTSLQNATISLKISHTYRGDLEVVLVSPSGRSVVLHNREGGSTDNVEITSRDISSSFSGSNPNGAWNLMIRDVDSGDIGTLNSVSLNLTAR